MGEWVEEIAKSYHRVLLGIFGKRFTEKNGDYIPFSEFAGSV